MEFVSIIAHLRLEISSESNCLLANYRYRYQLEFFVDKVKGRQPRLWIDGDDSVSNMRWIDRIYEKVSSFLSIHDLEPASCWVLSYRLA